MFKPSLFAAPFLLLQTLSAEEVIAPEPTIAELSAQQLPLTQKLHDLVTAKAKEEAAKAYEEAVPNADNAKITLVPIPAGTFKIGSPDGEEGRRPDEGPQKEIAISAFWMSETEIPWLLYRPFYENGDDRNKDGTIDYDGERNTTDNPKLDGNLVDAVSQPTTQYHDMFDSQKHNQGSEYPAMDMTQLAASKFCQWLTAQTGHFYRLPTEAEWEYACRAGTTTAYSFGDDANKLSEYAYYIDNSDETGHPTYGPVKQKKPNPWGLYDMHGNVAEWVLDAYAADTYAKLENGAKDPWQVPTKRYPRIVRGGSWNDMASDLRSAARAYSKAEWKGRDPQFPKSVWYHTFAQHVGFRIVRPVEIPTVEEMHKAWNTDFRTLELNAEDL